MRLSRVLFAFFLACTVTSCGSLRRIGNENGHEFVDLGLSVKWATMNVGAATPQESGDYYAWGELEPKEIYNWVTYRFCTEGDTVYDVQLSKYNTKKNHGTVDKLTSLSRADDVASVNWGGSWRYPTIEEIEELADENNCTWKWTTIKGVDGYKVKSKKKGYKRRYIFIPETSTLLNFGIEDTKAKGIYWTSSLIEAFYACTLSFIPDAINVYGAVERPVGLPVRPVCQ